MLHLTVSPIKAEGAAASRDLAARPEQAQQQEGGASRGVPSTSQEWIEALVAQMAGAADLAQARERATAVLHAFEQAILGQAVRALGLWSITCNGADVGFCQW